MPDPSKPVPLGIEAIEAAARAIHAKLGNERWPNVEGHREHWERLAQAAILAFLDAMGVTVELASMPREEHPSNPKGWRFVSRWFPIKGPVDE